MVDSRGGNSEEFFRHESSSSPPALASEGSTNSCNKSDLLACIMEENACTGLPADAELVAPDDYGVIVIDGGALIHSLPGTIVQGKTFAEYFTKVFCPKIQHELKRAARVDTVWDQYRSLSIKATTREKQGIATRQRASGSAKVPGNWQNFLSNAKNKKELFSFLSISIVQTSFQDGKQVYVTSGDQVLKAGNGPPMGRCNYEEADTRVLVHYCHALQYSSLGMVYTSGVRNMDFFRNRKDSQHDIPQQHCLNFGCDNVQSLCSLSCIHWVRQHVNFQIQRQAILLQAER